MFVDLNFPVPIVPGNVPQQSRKGKAKQTQTQAPSIVFTPAQLAAIEARIDLLEYLGYTVIAFNQVAHKRVDPKSHVNVLDPLLLQLRKRTSVLFLKRLTIVLDEESEKGFGLAPGNASLFKPYDIIALAPTTATSFSLACLTHTVPSPITAHIISVPLTLPRIPYNLKHTLVRTALKNGAVFEISYSGALGGEGDPTVSLIGGAESGVSAKRNWWAAAREVIRVTKGKGVVVTGGTVNQPDIRPPRDIINLITILDLSQNLAHEALTKSPQSLILRAHPVIVFPGNIAENRHDPHSSTSALELPTQPSSEHQEIAFDTSASGPSVLQGDPQPHQNARNEKKRTREETQDAAESSTSSPQKTGAAKKKKKKKSKDAITS